MLTLDQLPTVLQNTISNLIFASSSTVSPQLAFSKRMLENNFQIFKRSLYLKDEHIFYSVKTNYHTEIIKKLSELGAGFEIGSLGDLTSLQEHKIAPEKIIFSHPVKIPNHITQAYAYGVRTFAVDSESELIKLSQHAPGCKIFVRLSSSNEGSDWKLTEKFGASLNEAKDLLKLAKDHQLNAVGISLHVGWNNKRIETWIEAIKIIYQFVNQCNKEKIQLKFVNLGGGFPSHNVNQYDMMNKISEGIGSMLLKMRNDFGINVIAEPGSFLVNNAGFMLMRVYDIIKRKDTTWVYTDSGIFQGFYWILSGLKYELVYPYPISSRDKMQKYTITGPTLDSHDVFERDILLPQKLKPNDFLLVYPAGAYVHSSERYNGFGLPEVKIY